MSTILRCGYDLKFSEICLGTYFEWEDDLYLKISNDKAFEFGNDTFYTFESSDIVTVIDDDRIEVRVRE